MKNRLILLIGTTAAEGESLTRRLIPRGFDVRLATPAPDSPFAQSIRSLGAEVVGADLDDRASIDAALRGCWGVFGAAESTQQQLTLIRMVKAADVEEFACRLPRTSSDVTISAEADENDDHREGLANQRSRPGRLAEVPA